MVEVKRYKISPTYKKSVCENQIWCNKINNKTILINVYNVYRWGDFIIDLTEKQRTEILEKDHIELKDYEYELIEMWDGGCDFGVEIEDEESYTEYELEKINNMIYEWKKPIPEDEEEEDDGYSYEKLEHNGWIEDDCEISISCKCELEEYKD